MRAVEFELLGRLKVPIMCLRTTGFLVVWRVVLYELYYLVDFCIHVHVGNNIYIYIYVCVCMCVYVCPPIQKLQ